MINNVDQQQAYIDATMKRLPDTKKGEAYSLKKGDNLWNLAKKALNKNTASNQEISDYMLLIAKLNNLNTVKKMNSLQVSDTIYMPESSIVKSASVNSKQNQNPTNTLQPKQKSSSEQSILALKDIILKDKTIKTEMAYPRSLNLYHVYNDYVNPKTGYHSIKHPLMSFNLDTKGNLKEITFDDQNDDLNAIKYDYKMDKNGNILTNDYVKPQKTGKLDKNEVNELGEILKNFAIKAKLSY